MWAEHRGDNSESKEQPPEEIQSGASEEPQPALRETLPGVHSVCLSFHVITGCVNSLF